jgi:hypothetical protein
MNVFELRDRLIRDYASYISSFIQIRDRRIAGHVDQSLEDGLLWPEALIQLNPSFEEQDAMRRRTVLDLINSESAPRPN